MKRICSLVSCINHFYYIISVFSSINCIIMYLFGKYGRPHFNENIFLFIGVTLDKARGTEVWDPDVKPDLNESSHVFRGEHTLLVKQVNN